MRQLLFNRQMLWRWGAFIVAGLLLLVVAPLVLSDFRLSLLAKFLTYAVVALGLDLLWGYGGLLSLGQGVFFGLGAYAMAMYLKLEASGKDLPDFMGWSGLNQLPWFWKPFYNPIFAIAAAIIVPMLLAVLLGLLIFRNRIQGVYFSIITQALALILVTLFIGQQAITGGTNGITNFTTMFGADLSDKNVQHTLYFITVGCLGVAYLGCRWLVSSRYGRVLLALKEDENRVRFMGYNPVTLKVFVFALSAGLAGLGGALFVPQVGLISPSELGIVPSIEMVIWVAVGGRGTLVGAIIGALLVNWGKSSFSDSLPEIWQYFFGGSLIAVVLFFPTGIVGSLRQWSGQLLTRLKPKPLTLNSEIETPKVNSDVVEALK